MNGTFKGCINLTTAFIGNCDSVKSMKYTFAGCSSLSTMPSMPDKVEDLSYTFMDCTSLQRVRAEDCSAKYMNGTFMRCTSLRMVSGDLLDKVQQMAGCFQGCTSLTEAPGFPNSVETLTCVFMNCTSLEEVSGLPRIAEHADSAFYGCTALKKVSYIPISKNYSYIFYNCTNLSGDIKISMPYNGIGDLTNAVSPNTNGMFSGTTKNININLKRHKELNSF